MTSANPATALDEEDRPAAATTATSEDTGAFSAAPGYYGEDQATLGDRVAAARQAAGLTQAGLAERLGVGVKVISSWENDRSEPRANRLTMLSGLLGVTVSWLLTGAGEGVEPTDNRSPAHARASVFHLAVPVRDLDEASRFYGDIIGCRLGRRGSSWQDFDFFGHQLSAHLSPTVAARLESGLPLPHFGVVLERSAWSAVAERLRSEGLDFVSAPALNNVGAADEEGVFAVSDPSGNVIEFKTSRDPETLPA